MPSGLSALLGGGSIACAPQPFWLKRLCLRRAPVRRVRHMSAVVAPMPLVLRVTMAWFAEWELVHRWYVSQDYTDQTLPHELRVQLFYDLWHHARPEERMWDEIYGYRILLIRRREYIGTPDVDP